MIQRFQLRSVQTAIARALSLLPVSRCPPLILVHALLSCHHMAAYTCHHTSACTHSNCITEHRPSVCQNGTWAGHSGRI